MREVGHSRGDEGKGERRRREEGRKGGRGEGVGVGGEERKSRERR